MPLLPVPALSNATFFDASPLEEGDAVVPVITVRDSQGKTGFVRGSPFAVVDVTPPVVAVSAPMVSSSNLEAEWTVSEPSTVYVGLYEDSGVLPSAAEVVAGTGTGFVVQEIVSDGAATTAVWLEAPGVLPSTQYVVAAVARDSAGNLSAVATANATTSA